MATGAVLGGTSKRKLEEAYDNGYRAGFLAYADLPNTTVYTGSGTRASRMIPVSMATDDVKEAGSPVYIHKNMGTTWGAGTDNQGQTWYGGKCSKCSLKTQSIYLSTAKDNVNKEHYSTVKPNSKAEIVGYVV